jgi:hypothetical protein
VVWALCRREESTLTRVKCPGKTLLFGRSFCNRLQVDVAVCEQGSHGSESMKPSQCVCCVGFINFTRKGW